MESKNISSSQNFLEQLDDRTLWIGCIVFLIVGISCGIWSLFYVRSLSLNAWKFGVLYALMNCLFFVSISCLSGPGTFYDLFSHSKLLFTLIYIFAMIAALFCAIFIQKTILTAFFVGIQVILCLWYIIDYFLGWLLVPF